MTKADSMGAAVGQTATRRPSRMTSGGNSFADEAPELLIAVVFCIALVPFVAWVARWSERQLAMTV
ncbi:MAG: hypothetical protein MUQ27_15150 [Acidimicrobiia bacterium]|nr:hypothetical protein [Acidimicrobiia bacterium]